MVVQCEECEMWWIVYSKKKLDSQSLSLLEKILDDIVYTCGAMFDELDLPPTLKSVCVRTLHCNDPIEKLYYSCSFSPVCYYCGKDILIEVVSPEVYPICSDCSSHGKVSETKPGKCNHNINFTMTGSCAFPWSFLQFLFLQWYMYMLIVPVSLF